MDNNQGVNNYNPNGTNQPIPTNVNPIANAINNNPNVAVNNPVPNPQMDILNNMNKQEPVINNQNTENITLGTVSNTTYSETIGDISQNVNTGNPNVDTAVGNYNNQFLNPNGNYNETSLSDLNVDGSYNKMEKKPDYINDPQVQENIKPKKNTVTITKELKTVIIITGALLVFIFLMPLLFDLINKIRFR